MNKQTLKKSIPVFFDIYKPGPAYPPREVKILADRQEWRVLYSNGASIAAKMKKQ